MVALVATVGNPSANSYLTAAGADAALPLVAATSRCNAWTALDTPSKEVYLMRAAKMLDQYIEWDGRKYQEDQKLGWPRDFAYGPDRCTYLPWNVIPEAVSDSQALLALNLSEGFDPADQAASPVDYVKVSSVSVSFDSDRSARSSMLLPPEVVERIRGYGEYIGSSGGGRSVGMVRG